MRKAEDSKGREVLAIQAAMRAAVGLLHWLEASVVCGTVSKTIKQIGRGTTELAGGPELSRGLGGRDLTFGGWWYACRSMGNYVGYWPEADTRGMAAY